MSVLRGRAGPLTAGIENITVARLDDEAGALDADFDAAALASGLRGLLRVIAETVLAA